MTQKNMKNSNEKTSTIAGLSQNDDYKSWLKSLKQQVLQTQIKAAVQVNSTLLTLYWQLGADIVKRQQESTWGGGFLKQLSKDLMVEFPSMKGFSERNIKYIRQWFCYWSKEGTIGQQLVAQLSQIPWGHNLKIISQCKTLLEASFYVKNTIEHGWSRNVLTHQIDSGLWQREGKAINNFSATLPAAQSGLAENLKSSLPSIEQIESELSKIE